MTEVASIGATHPWNIAGAGLDIAIGQILGVGVFTVVAGVSAQDDRGLRALHAVPSEVVRAQLMALPIERIQAIRIGALVSAGNMRAVAQFIRAHPNIAAIVDPVLAASTGDRLANAEAIAVLRDELATAPSVILTPNLEEAAVLLNGRPIRNEGQLQSAAMLLLGLGCRAVVLKGGHLAGDPVDALATAGGVELLHGERIAGSMRGTGCTLAMALACELARGSSLREAVESARAFVKGRLVSAAKADASS